MRTRFFQNMTGNAASRIKNIKLFFNHIKNLKSEIAELAVLCAIGVYSIDHIKKDGAKRRAEKMLAEKSVIEQKSCENTTEQDQADLKQARKILAQIELASFECSYPSTKRFQ